MSTEDLRRRRRRADSDEDSDSDEDRVVGSDDDEGASIEFL